MVVEKKKYIIELPENTHWIQWIMEGTKDHHPYMDYKQVKDLTPYTEDSAYAHGYTEAESKYREIRDELEKQIMIAKEKRDIRLFEEQMKQLKEHKNG